MLSNSKTLLILLSVIIICGIDNSVKAMNDNKNAVDNINQFVKGNNTKDNVQINEKY